MLTWIILAALFGFAFGLWGQRFLKSADRPEGSRSHSRGWTEVLKAGPQGPGVSIVGFDASVGVLAPSASDMAQVDRLFTAAYGAPKPDYRAVLDHSYAWITVWHEGELVGFANVAWDGGPNFFLLDIAIQHPDEDEIFEGIIQAAVDRCRKRGGWLRVDSNKEMMASFFGPIGFQAVSGGRMHVEPGTTPA